MSGTTSNMMGPGAFMWPADRPWAAQYDNTPPCGSSSGVGERTPFLLVNGKLALVTQETTRSVHIGVSYSQDPKTQQDFLTIIGPQQIGAMGVGHTCISVPDAPNSFTPGTNATFNMFYVSPNSGSEVFWACTDIVYVNVMPSEIDIPCFNATEENPGTVSVDSSVHTGDITNPHATASIHAKMMTPGQIAGAVVGTLVGGTLLAVSIMFLVRRYTKKKGKGAVPEMRERPTDAEKAMSDTSS